MRTITNKAIKELLEYRNEFVFDVRYSKNGVARIYINDTKTPIHAGGYGYCKESAVLADFINLLCEWQEYDTSVYGNRNGLISGGVGVESVKASFESIPGNKLSRIYWSDQASVYKLIIGGDL
jgi:hypothetical protein